MTEGQIERDPRTVDRRRVTFGIKTAPQYDATYADIARIWRQADDLPEIEHAWLWDHMMPLGPDPSGPCLENWTLLGALAAQTQRLRIGHLVTSRRGVEGVRQLRV